MLKAKAVFANASTFYLMKPMDQTEYRYFPLNLSPDEILVAYNLCDLAHNSHIYAKISCGIDGLPQAGLLANNLLGKHLAKHGCFQVQHTPGLWEHAS